MNISEIVNYVNRTPHNTNPNVIASMVQGANEQAVYESVEELKRNGGVGYTEPAKVFTHDGNCNTDKQYGEIYRLTEEILDLTKLIKFTMVMQGQTITMTKDEFIAAGGEVTENEIGDPTGGWLVQIFADGNYDGVPAGTYTVCIEDFYLPYIAFDSDVHPIDPKYLPEGGVGYTGKSVITFDGNPEGLPSFLGYCRISDIVDLNTVANITGVMNGELVTITSDMFEVRKLSELAADAIYMKDNSFNFPTDAYFVICFRENVDNNIPSGLYVFCNPDYNSYVSRVEFAGVIHPIDPKYLGNAMPNVVDLTEFEVGDGTTINDNMLLAMQGSISGGTLQSLEVELPNSSFSDACSVNRQLIIKMTMSGADIFIPSSVCKADDDGEVLQISGACMMILPNVGVVESKTILDLYDNPTLKIYVKSELLT